MKKFIYIDDDTDEIRINGTLMAFNQKNHIEVERHFPSEWDSTIHIIEKAIKNNIDGIILDLRLSDYYKEKKANYRGSSLAQEIRTRQKEGLIAEVPIILFSGNEQLEKSLEYSAIDLFDISIQKEDLIDVNHQLYRDKLYSLADAYNILQETKAANKLLNIDENLIDKRLIAELEKLKQRPSHEVSYFIIKQIIEKGGILIDENTLASRLGVDLQESEDWIELKKHLDFAAYTGIFSRGWKRWWMPLINKWWSSICETQYLQSLSAIERVQILKEKLVLDKIIAAGKIDKAESDEFWVVCKAYEEPLDPIDGVLLAGQENLYPWQDAQYISVDAAIRSKGKGKSWNSVATFEEDRLTELKKLFSRNKSK